MEITTALLCDHAQVRDGLLFVLSGGITRVRRPSFPGPLGLALACMLELDVIEAEHRHQFELVIIGEDGDEVGRATADIQIGDREGAYAGENVQVPLAIDMHGAQLPRPGAYELRIYVDGQHRRTAQFWAEEAGEIQV